MSETVGQRLRRLRAERGLSQRELSEPGVSYAYISRIEAGSRRPSVKALRKLAAKLGVSAHYLEHGREQETWVVVRQADVGEVEVLASFADEAEADELVALCERRDGPAYSTWSAWTPIATSGRQAYLERFGKEVLMADRFTLEIELGNAAMQEPRDIAEALRQVAGRFEDVPIEALDDEGRIRDLNGNTVGTWRFS